MEAATADRELIKAKLRTQFGSVFNFEDAEGLPRKSVSDFLRGRPNKRVSDAITKVLAPKGQSDKSDSNPERALHRLIEGAR
ncbi:MAG: hypothetical protein V4808_07030 [Pseudomonadota bacterium]